MRDDGWHQKYYFVSLKLIRGCGCCCGSVGVVLTRRISGVRIRVRVILKSALTISVVHITNLSIMLMMLMKRMMNDMIAIKCRSRGGSFCRSRANSISNHIHGTRIHIA